MQTDQTTPEPRWLNIQQAGTAAGVSRRTIYNWLTAGRIQARRTAGGALRILETSLWRTEPSQ